MLALFHEEIEHDMKFEISYLNFITPSSLTIKYRYRTMEPGNDHSHHSIGNTIEYCWKIFLIRV